MVDYVSSSGVRRALESADLVVVGAGLFGATIAEHVARLENRRVVLLDKRSHIGGNIFSSDDPQTGIHVHRYGPHIFHTSNDTVARYVSEFSSFNNYVHRVWSRSQGQTYSLPVNLHTLSQFFRENLSPGEARALLPAPTSDASKYSNFEEAAIGAVGEDLYRAFFRGYTLKQWQEDPRALPASVFSRLPVRFDFDSRYFSDHFQGIPVEGYTKLVENMLASPMISVALDTDFFSVREQIPSGIRVVYTGPIDAYFENCYGKLKWRTLDFEWERHDVPDYQGAAQMNYADENVPWTRIVEYQHFDPGREARGSTIISKEFSRSAESPDDEPYYPVRTSEDIAAYSKYRRLSSREQNVYFGGRLGSYAYFDMDMTIASAISLFRKYFQSNR